MASPIGRALRVIPGVVLLYFGFFGDLGLIFGLIGIVLIASGALNYCALSKLFGGPFDGRKAK